MRLLLGAIVAGFAMMLIPGVLWFLIGETAANQYMVPLLTSMGLGFATVVVAGSMRAQTRCPKCDRRFGGDSEHPDSRGESIFSSSCRWCGYRPGTRVL